MPLGYVDPDRFRDRVHSNICSKYTTPFMAQPLGSSICGQLANGPPCHRVLVTPAVEFS
jgi:hypothetical protein